jgi:hypothetical protein
VVLVEEPLAVTNILDSGGVGLNPAVTISYYFDILAFSLFYSFSGFLGPFQSNAKGKKGIICKNIF